TPRWLEYEKADTVICACVVVIGAAAIMMATASAFTGSSEFGHYQDGLHIAQGLASHVSPMAGTIFALLLFDASIVGASAVTLATSYAFGDMFGLRHSLHRGVREAKLFYASYTGMVVLGAGWSWVRDRGAPPEPEISREERENWRMPALALLERPPASLSRRIALYALSSYLVVAIILLAVKAVQLAIQR